MSAAWKTNELGKLCEIALGKTPARAEKKYWDEDRQTANVWLSIADLQNTENKRVRDSKEYLSDEGAALCREVAQGTLLVSFKLTLGRVAFAGRNLYTNEAIAALTVCDDQELSKEYLFYYLRFFDWRKAAAHDLKLKGVTLNKAKLKKLLVHYPSLAEQERIVQLLDKAFESIAAAEATTEQNAQNARALLTSQLEQVFTPHTNGWVAAAIGQHIRFIDYRGRTPKKTESGLRLITAKNVKMGYLRTTPEEFVAPESYDAWMTRGIPRRGDVLFTTEAPLANVAQLDTGDKVVFAQRIIVMQPDEARLKSTFLKYLLLSGPTQRRLHAEGTGATAKGIKARVLKKVAISFPSDLDEQDKIVAKLDALAVQTERLAAIYEEKLRALDALRQSIMHQTFGREIREVS